MPRAERLNLSLEWMAGGCYHHQQINSWSVPGTILADTSDSWILNLRSRQRPPEGGAGADTALLKDPGVGGDCLFIPGLPDWK